MGRDNINTVTSSASNATDQDQTPVTGTDVGPKRALDANLINPTSSPVNTNQVNVTNAVTSVETGITAASGFIVLAVTDQEYLKIEPQSGGQWFYSFNLAAVPTVTNGHKFTKHSPFSRNNIKQDIRIAPSSTTGDVTITKGVK